MTNLERRFITKFGHINYGKFEDSCWEQQDVINFIQGEVKTDRKKEKDICYNSESIVIGDKIFTRDKLKEKKAWRPLCPECKKGKMEYFLPPKDGIVGTPEGYHTIGSPEYINWGKAHLYCTNHESNCTYTFNIIK